MHHSNLTPVLFVLLFVLVLLTFAGIIYLYITAKNKERLALINKGMDPNLARSDFWLQAGIIGAGIAAGLIFGDVIHTTYGPLFAFLFAGGGLVLYNIYRKRRMRG
jgi:hypothetical protein